MQKFAKICKAEHIETKHKGPILGCVILCNILHIFSIAHILAQNKTEVA